MHLLHRVGERLHERVDRLLAGVHLRRRLLGEPLEGRAGQVEKGATVAVQRFGGKRAERVAQVQLGLVQERLRGAERRLLLLELAPEPLVVLACRGQFSGKPARTSPAAGSERTGDEVGERGSSGDETSA